MKKFMFPVFFVFLFASSSLALNINDPAPPFSLRDIDGGIFYLSEHVSRSKKGVILNFFAYHCKPCRNELPVLNRLVDEFKGMGITVVIIGWKDDFDKIEKMLGELKVDRPIVLSDKYGKVGDKYGVRGLPLTIFIGSDGKVKDIVRGELPEIEKVFRDKAGKL